MTNERVQVASLNVHAFATLGSVHDLAATMHLLSLFPDVFIATDETAPGILLYLVDTAEVEA